MNFPRLIISLLAPLAAGFIGSFFTASSITSWYAGLEKPSFNPPNFIFGPVWTTLYILMGVSVYLVWQSQTKTSSTRNVRWLFWVHLVLNASWSLVFFGLENPLAALFVIIALWGMIVLLIIQFWRISKLASLLLVPYLCWVSFATVLNFAIWQLN